MSKKVVIIGGGIVGLATAYTLLQQHPNWHITVLEKETAVAQHQSGRNSGVLHSGIYYQPNSLKAQNCRRGKALMEQFCQQESIPYLLCGKVIVATREDERAFLQTLLQRGQANGVQCRLIGQAELAEIEPHVKGLEAIHVPEAGIADYKAVCQRLADRIREQGAQIYFGEQVQAIAERADSVTILTNKTTHQAEQLIVCAGLYADKLAQEDTLQIVPFRGEYYDLNPNAQHLCNSLIYPVPDPQFPFLGVHFTRTIAGGVECGPNAVLALAREGYNWQTINWRELAESVRYAGFQQLAQQHWRMGLGEMWRSVSKQAFVTALQRLIPAIQADDLVTAPAGVRAQLLNPQGELVYDFTLRQTARTLHLLNAPSPAATASFSIAHMLITQLESTS